MKTYNQFYSELSRLRRLYFTAVYSVMETRLIISKKLRSGEVDGSAPLYFGGREDEEHLISHTIFELGGRLKGQFLRYLRELVFVRMISALEVFLVDNVKEVFLITKVPFKRDIMINMTQGELLSTESLLQIQSKIINKESRNLHSGGFNEIAKYYLRTFGMQFNNYQPGIVQLEEYHERRHLLIHQMGRTDQKYRDQHGTKSKKITVDEDYLLECLQSLLTFASAVNEALEKNFSRDNLPPKQRSPFFYSFTVGVEPGVDYDFLSPSFEFWVGERLASLNDILTSMNYVDEDKVEIKLRGNRDIIKNYIKVLREYKKRGELEISEQKGSLQSCRLSTEEISKIRALLPAKPWPIGIHKTIAEELGLTKSEVYKAMSIIMAEDGEF